MSVRRKFPEKVYPITYGDAFSYVKPITDEEFDEFSLLAEMPLSNMSRGHFDRAVNRVVHGIVRSVFHDKQSRINWEIENEFIKGRPIIGPIAKIKPLMGTSNSRAVSLNRLANNSPRKPLVGRFYRRKRPSRKPRIKPIRKRGQHSNKIFRETMRNFVIHILHILNDYGLPLALQDRMGVVGNPSNGADIKESKGLLLFMERAFEFAGARADEAFTNHYYGFADGNLMKSEDSNEYRIAQIAATQFSGASRGILYNYIADARKSGNF